MVQYKTLGLDISRRNASNGSSFCLRVSIRTIKLLLTFIDQDLAETLDHSIFQLRIFSFSNAFEMLLMCVFRVEQFG